MSTHYWLSDAQMEHLKPFFPKRHSKLRVDDCRVLVGIIFINHSGLRRRNAARSLSGAHVNHDRCEQASATRSSDPAQASQSAPHALEPWGEKGRACQIGRTKGGEGRRNRPVGGAARKRYTKLHAVTDVTGRPIGFFMPAELVSADPTGRAGFWPTGATMLIGSEKPWNTKG